MKRNKQIEAATMRVTCALEDLANKKTIDVVGWPQGEKEQLFRLAQAELGMNRIQVEMRIR